MDNLKDKAIYGVLAVILVITSLTLILQMHDAFRTGDTSFYVPEAMVVPKGTPEPEESPLLRNKNLSRPLSGGIVMLGEDGTYLRLSVIDVGVLSVGITEDTQITQEGTAITLTEIAPFSEATLEVIPLDDSQMYDFLAVSVAVTAGSALAPEGEIEQTDQPIELLDN